MTDGVLITGGLGYLGGRIACHLQGTGEYHLRLGSRMKKANNPDWLKHGCIVPMDLTSDSSLDAACRNVKVVIHLAALNHIDCAKYPEQALIINSLGTLKLLLAAKRAGVKRFIYFSTSHIYGSPLVGEISEKNVPRPVHPYSITHRVAEDYVLAAHDKGILTGLVIRLTNGVGYPMDVDANCWTLVANDLCRQAVVNKVLALHSSGLQWRDFLPLSDIVSATTHLLRLSVDDCGDGLFNLGGACSLRVIDLAEQIAVRCETILGFKPDVEHPDAQEGDVPKPLEYRIDKLLDTGFMLQGSVNDETDATLDLCRRSFGN